MSFRLKKTAATTMCDSWLMNVCVSDGLLDDTAVAVATKSHADRAAVEDRCR